MQPRFLFRFIDTVLHIGAGRSDLVDQLIAIGVRDVYLTESDPGLFAKLKGRHKTRENIKFLQAAIIGEETEESRSLIRYNLSRLNSLRPISGALDLYPGIRVEETLSVPNLPIFKMMESIDHKFGDVNCLIMQAAGEEFELLNALHTSDVLKYFDFVLLEAGETSLYEGGKNAAQITEWMQKKGFTSANRSEVSDCDIPLLKFNIDRKKTLSDFEEQHRQLVAAHALTESLDAKLEAIVLTQSSSQCDLKDLQSRYKELQLEKAAQDELLMRVTQRLKAASRYLGSSVDPSSDAFDARPEMAEETPRGEQGEKDEQR